MAHDLIFGQTKRDWSCGAKEPLSPPPVAAKANLPPEIKPTTSDKAARVATWAVLGLAGAVVYMGFTHR